jgi:pyruvate dehydrogenase E1 component
VDANSIVLATLYALAQRGELTPDLVSRAGRDLNLDPDKPSPFFP